MEILFLLIAIPVVFFMAKGNVEMHNNMKEKFKKRGLQWCLAELATCSSSEYKNALKGAIEEIKREQFN